MTLMTAVVMGVLIASSAHAAPIRVSCHDPDGIGGVPGEWFATYTVTDHADGALADFRELGFRPDGKWRIAYAPAVDASWQLSVRPLDHGGLDTQKVTTLELLGTGGAASYRRLDLYPQLQTPNGHCMLFLRSYDYLAAADPVPSGPRVAIVGDSLTHAFTAIQQQRHRLARQFAAYNWSVEVSALSGLAWQIKPDDPAGSNLLDEIRGLLATRPDIFVFALGTNDALLITKARIMQSAMTTEQARHYTVAQIAQTLAEADTSSPAMCKILVTPSTHPYLLITQYTDEAIFVGDVLRFFAGQPTRTDISPYVKGLRPFANTHIADWAQASASEEMRALLPDGIHMAEEAARRFRALWIRAIASCEKSAGAIRAREAAR